MKSNAKVLGREITDELEKKQWLMLPSDLQRTLLENMKNGQTPEDIEANMLSMINEKFGFMSENQRNVHAQDFFLAANYAYKNNLHLN